MQTRREDSGGKRKCVYTVYLVDDDNVSLEPRVIFTQSHFLRCQVVQTRSNTQKL